MKALDTMDGMSHKRNMTESSLTWKLVDETGEKLGAKGPARLKWRQRGVPACWRIQIVQDLMARGIAIALSDFDRLEPTPGRIAA